MKTMQCFDQICKLKMFVECSLSDEEFTALPIHKKWCKYFQQSKNVICLSESLRISRFFFLWCLSVSQYMLNGYFRWCRVRGQKKEQDVRWDNERNFYASAFSTTLENFMYCGEFSVFLKSNNSLLKKIRSSEKYA